MPRGIPRKDITVEKCVELYKEHQNAAEIARIFQTSVGVIINRLHKAGIDTSTKDYSKRRKKPKRVKFDSKREQAHYICTMLREPLTDFVIECMTSNHTGHEYKFLKED